MDKETKVCDNLQLFQKRLRELRGEKSLQKASQDLGISRATLGYYENGDRKPDIEILTKIAAYYNVSCDYLLGLTDITSAEMEDRLIIKKIGISETSLQALYNINNATFFDAHLEKNTLELLLSDTNSLLKLLTMYLFTNFDSVCEVNLGDKNSTSEVSGKKISITQLGFFDGQLNTVHVNRNKDFFLNAYLLDIQKELISLRQLIQTVLTENQENFTDSSHALSESLISQKTSN